MLEFVKTQKILFFLLLLTIVITLTPFFQIGFTTTDDIEFYLTQHLGAKWKTAIGYAKTAGRFSFLITYPIYCIIYFFEDLIVPKVINLILVVLNYFFAGIIFGKIFNSKNVIWLTLIIGLASMQIAPVNNPITGYPVFFTFSFFLVQIAVLSAILGAEKNKIKYIWYSAILFFTSFLFFETYLIYSLFTVIGLFIHVVKCKKQNHKFISFAKISYPIFVSVFLYVLIYWIYRIYFPAIYDGAKIKKAIEFSEIFSSMYNYSRGAFPFFPLEKYEWVLREKSNIINQSRRTIGFWIQNFELLWIIKTCLIFILLVYFFKKLNTEKIRNYFWMPLLVIPLILLPNLFISITEKYQYFWKLGAWQYITTYFSHFGMVLLYLSIIIFTVVFLGNKKIISTILFYLLAIIISLGSLFVDLSNNLIARDLKQINNKFEMIDFFLLSDDYAQIPEKSTIVAPNFNKLNSYTNRGVNSKNYWSFYTKVKTNKSVNFTYDLSYDKICDSINKTIYYLNYKQAIKTEDQFIAYSKIDNNHYCNSDGNTKLFGNKIRIFYYSYYKSFSIYIPTLKHNDSIKVNNKFYYNDNNWLSIKYDKPKGISEIIVETDKIVIDDINISNIIINPNNIIKVSSGIVK